MGCRCFEGSGGDAWLAIVGGKWDDSGELELLGRAGRFPEAVLEVKVCLRLRCASIVADMV